MSRRSLRRSMRSRRTPKLWTVASSSFSAAPWKTLPDDPVRVGALDAQLEQVVVEGRLVLEVHLLLALGDLEERRLRDVDEALLDQLGHLAEEERQEERADVAPIDVGVGHDDDAVVADLLGVVVLATDPRSKRGDQRRNLLAREHLVEARLLHVQDLPLERQDGLVLPVATLLGRATGALALDEVELRELGVSLLAVGQLSGQRGPIQGPLCAARFHGPCAPRCAPGPRRPPWPRCASRPPDSPPGRP